MDRRATGKCEFSDPGNFDYHQPSSCCSRTNQEHHHRHWSWELRRDYCSNSLRLHLATTSALDGIHLYYVWRLLCLNADCLVILRPRKLRFLQFIASLKCPPSYQSSINLADLPDARIGGTEVIRADIVHASRFADRIFGAPLQYSRKRNTAAEVRVETPLGLKVDFVFGQSASGNGDYMLESEISLFHRTSASRLALDATCASGKNCLSSEVIDDVSEFQCTVFDLS